MFQSIVAGILSEHLEDCKWMADVKRKKHDYHAYISYISKKSITSQLPIIDANEAKHEDCLKIMDEYEKIITQLFTEANGNCHNYRHLSFISQMLSDVLIHTFFVSPNKMVQQKCSFSL